MSKENTTITGADIHSFIREMKVNRMYELAGNANFKWAMIESNELGYCWTLGYKGVCTTIYSMNLMNDIKYWTSEEEAKSSLIERLEHV